MPEIKIANQDTLLDVKATAEATRTGVDTLLNRPVGFQFYHEMLNISKDTMAWQPMTLAYPINNINFQYASAARRGVDISPDYMFEVFIFGSGSTTSTSAYKVHLNTFEWTQLANCPSSLYQSAATVIAVTQYNRDIYVLCGQAAVSTRFYKYSVSGNSWSELANAPVASTNAAIGVMNNELYVAGGTGSGLTSTTLRKYTPSSDSWMTLASLPSTAMNAMGGVINGELYVLATSKVLMKYNRTSDSWTTLAAPPFSNIPQQSIVRGAHAVFGNKLVFAGVVEHDKNQVWFYDSATNSWERTANSLWPFNNGVGVVSPDDYDNNVFYTFGGPTATFHKMSTLYSILGEQAHGEVKQGQRVYYQVYGAVGGVRVDNSYVTSGNAATRDGRLTTYFRDGLGAIRGWVQ